ncbi:MAG: hypothetical protein ACP5VQ_07575 [Phycisphaerae bacterium]
MKSRIAYRRSPAALVNAPNRLPRWLLLPALLIATLLVMLVISGSQMLAVLATLCNAAWAGVIILPAILLGLAITHGMRTLPVIKLSPWPLGFRLVLAAALGLGLLSLATLALGSCGLISGPICAALLLAAAAIGYPFARQLKPDLEFLRRPIARQYWSILLACIPIAVLLIAVTFPAGTLWHTEGNGFDVLEYHLQLPRQFLELHSTAPVKGNIYSYLSLNMEMLYLMLAAITRSAVGSGYIYALVFAAQSLHAMVTLLAAAGILLAPLNLKAPGRILAVLLFLVTPWTLVVGSLAYNDGLVLLYGVLALSMAGAARSQWRSGEWIILGVLLGLAVGTKMTAGVMVALPVAAMLLARRNFRQLAVVVITALLLYSPWMARSMVATHTAKSFGNPIFPIFTGTLGRGHWSKSIALRFDHGHRPPVRDAGVAGHLRALADQSILDRQWSPGIAAWVDALRADPGFPGPQTPWYLRLGPIWLVVLPAIGLGLFCGRQAWLMIVCLAVQVIAWLTCTQLQARFLLPSVIPLAWLLGMAAELLSAYRMAATTLMTLQAAACGLLLRPEAGLFLGPLHTQMPPPIGAAISLPQDWLLESPPPGQFTDHTRYYLEGLSTPLYIRGQVIYATVFDRNELARAFHRGGAKAALRYLQMHHVNYLLVDWPEIIRLRKTYGFDPIITPRNIGTLQALGLRPIAENTVPGIVIYRVPPS